MPSGDVAVAHRVSFIVQIAKQQEDKEKRKEEKKKAEEELQILFKPVIGQQALAAGERSIDAFVAYETMPMLLR